MRLHVRAASGGGFFSVDGQERLRPLGIGRLAAQGLDGAAVRVEDNDALVAPVGDVYESVVVHGDGGRAAELPVAAPGFAELGDELAVRRETLNAVVAPVGDVEIAVRRDCRAPGERELAVAVAMRSEAAQIFAIRAEDLRAVVALVGDVEAVFGVEG